MPLCVLKPEVLVPEKSTSSASNHHQHLFHSLSVDGRSYFLKKCAAHRSHSKPLSLG